MLRHVHPLVIAVFASSLVVAVSQSGAALAASQCIEKPTRQINQAGHWYYHADRAHHRRCWSLETSEVTVRPASYPDPAPAPIANLKPSWFSWLSTGLEHTFSSEARQNNIPDNSSTVTKTPSSKHPKTATHSPKSRKTIKLARKERSRIAPLPEANGAASAASQNQLLSQVPEKVEKETPTLAPFDRGALFEDFLRWYMERSMLSGK